MPAPQILKALNMTCAEWGALPYDPATGNSPERTALLERAKGILKVQKEQKEKFWVGRLEDVEGKVSTLNAEVLTLNRRVSELEQTTDGLKGGQKHSK